MSSSSLNHRTFLDVVTAYFTQLNRKSSIEYRIPNTKYRNPRKSRPILWHTTSFPPTPPIIFLFNHHTIPFFFFFEHNSRPHFSTTIYLPTYLPLHDFFLRFSSSNAVCERNSPAFQTGLVFFSRSFDEDDKILPQTPRLRLFFIFTADKRIVFFFYAWRIYTHTHPRRRGGGDASQYSTPRTMVAKFCSLYFIICFTFRGLFI